MGSREHETGEKKTPGSGSKTVSLGFRRPRGWVRPITCSGLTAEGEPATAEPSLQVSQERRALSCVELGALPGEKTPRVGGKLLGMGSVTLRARVKLVPAFRMLFETLVTACLKSFPVYVCVRSE